MKRIIIFSFLLILSLMFVITADNIKYLPESVHSGHLIYGDTNLYYMVSGRVSYNDNDEPLQSGYVKALAYDKEKDLVVTIDSARLQDGGLYLLPRCWKDSLFIMAYGDDELDCMPGFHDTTINWQESYAVSHSTKHDNVNIKLNRSFRQYSGSYNVSGRIFNEPNNQSSCLNGALVYARLGSQYIGYSISNTLGQYFLDSLPPGNYEIMVSRLGYYMDYRIIQIGQTYIDTVNFYLSKVASVNIPHEKVPLSYSLSQNYPNPFNPVTKIKFDLPKPDLTLSGANGLRVRLIIYDALGREIAVLVNQQLQPGRYEIEWDGTNYPSGVYFYILTAGDFVEARKMALVK